MNLLPDTLQLLKVILGHICDNLGGRTELLTLKQIKTFTQSTMKEGHFHSLAMCLFEKQRLMLTNLNDLITDHYAAQKE